MNLIGFHCEECEMDSQVEVQDVGSYGFSVDCPHCKTHWAFSAVGYDRPSEKEDNA